MRLYEAEREYWGNKAAGVLCVCPSTGRFLVMLRSDEVMEPNTWGILSGKLDGNESFEAAAEREAKEETGYTGQFELTPLYRYEDDGFVFQNFLGVVDEEFEPKLNWETDEYRWLTLEKLQALPKKHFGLIELLKDKKSFDVLSKYTTQTTKKLTEAWRSFLTESDNEPVVIHAATAEELFKYFHLSNKKLPGDSFTFSAQRPRTPLEWEDDFTRRVSMASTIKDCILAAGVRPFIYAGDLKNTSKDDIPIVDVEKTWDKCPYKDYGGEAVEETGRMENFRAFQWFVDAVYGQKDKLFFWYKNDWMEATPKLVDDGIAIYIVKSHATLKLASQPDKEFSFDYLPTSLPAEYQKAWYACVPDAKQTHEKWSPQDTEMIYLGRFQSLPSSYRAPKLPPIELADSAVEYLRKNGIEI